MTSRCFLGTHYVMDEDWKTVWGNVQKDVVCLMGQREICPTTSRDHWQVFIKFKQPCRITGALKTLGIKMSLTRQTHGSEDFMAAYVQKLDTSVPDTFFKFGTTVKQGTRTDLQKVTDRVDEGASLVEIASEFPREFVKFHNGISKLVELKVEKRDWPMDVQIYWGPPGTGKTRKAYEENPDVYFKDSSKWWDNYRGEECVIIDDFDPSTMDWKFQYWLTLLDRYPMRVEMKGGSTEFRSRKIIITSNFDPKEWFAGRSNRDAFFRRVSKIEQIPKPCHDVPCHEVDINNIGVLYPTQPGRF